ncbi:Pkinase-domain-containing protein [Viridothelium virens]|uniref:Pkinase-domain-containing protein n=1 Tax=Viridothelium virens TaxID=1048519 RepID=A0A6A6HEQ9_VIRVR|nr:Pkinase-domain-containing protein [Viridothelium virens]
MTTIQNLKNFIRHGKQARNGHSPQGDATTQVSNVHAQQQRYGNYGGGHAPQAEHFGVSEPNIYDHKPLQGHAAPHGDYSVAAIDNRNVAAQAGEAAAHQAGQRHKQQAAHQAGTKERKQDYDPSVLERIVAEERESKGKLPKYPGLDRYTLLEKMGDGAFSNVYRAKDNTGQYAECAIKVVRKFEMNSSQGDNHLHPDFKKVPKTVERANILKEVQIMRQLDHPNIVKLVDFSESRQYYYIVLELCPGGELFHQIVRLTYFSEDLSRHVIIQVAKALEYLHEQAGVVHRDIKPENLLFYGIPFVPTRNPKPRAPEDEDKADEGEFIKGVGAGGIGVIKIADFGLSKVIWDTQTMTPCGTVGYTAPEIVKDERYSKSVDMWALGCVLYTLLCGFPPFYDESIQVLTEKVARGQYTFLSPWWDDISKSAQDLVSHLLTVDPEKRYDIKQFLNHPWIRESQEETTAAADAPPLATPLVQRQKQLGHTAQQADQQNLQPSYPYLDPSPSSVSAGGRRMDFRSPGAVNLREVFDVSYAVHRQEEEGKRRKNFKHGYRGSALPPGFNTLDEDTLMDEEDEDEAAAVSAPYDERSANPPAKLPKSGQGAAGTEASGVGAVEQKMRNTTLSAAAQARQANAPARGAGQAQQQQQQEGRGYGQHSPAVAAAAKRQVRNKGAFELSLDNATLLGRRGKKPDPSGLRTELVQ